MQLQPYLIFPGNCREALGFYEGALGGTVLHITTVGESPVPHEPEHADLVHDSAFVSGDLRFRASDGEPGKDPVVGHNVAMFVMCSDAGTQAEAFGALGQGGDVLFPLNGGFGMVVDRYGIRWMLALT